MYVEVKGKNPLMMFTAPAKVSSKFSSDVQRGKIANSLERNQFIKAKKPRGRKGERKKEWKEKSQVREWK